jgi:hypothetical protein
MRRTIIVGDVHGCSAELDALLDRVAFSDGDRLVLVGDLVARGPDSLGVLDIARRTRAIVVRGNHEEKLLLWRAKKQSHARGLGKRPAPLGRVHAKIARELRAVDWVLLASTPDYCDLPEHGARVVHAGVVPGIPFEHQERTTLMRIRALTAQGGGRGPRREGEEKGAEVLWGALYAGPPHIVFGHNAMSEPQLHPWATGLDTSCVYGGRLTAMVIPEGQRVPRGRDVRQLLVWTRARKTYCLGKKSIAFPARRVA